MPTKKKTIAPETEAVKYSEPTAPAKKKAATRPAATHKTAARKAPAKTAAAKKSSETKPAFSPAAHEAEIAHEAYVLWVNRGYAHGQAHQDWAQATEIVRARYENE